jgi:hypothetical protein
MSAYAFIWVERGLPIPKPVQNETAARQLLETAEGLTGPAWRVAEPVPAFAGRWRA